MKIRQFGLLLTFLFLVFPIIAEDAWYNSAQARIDTLRKGDFTINLKDGLGNVVSDSIRVRMKKHEFPWGYAIDLSSSSSSTSVNSGYTSNTITNGNSLYQTERWGKYLAYQFQVTAGKSYDLTLKLAEIYSGCTLGFRLFDVYVDGIRIIKDLDKYALANGLYKAVDTTFRVLATSSKLKLELLATSDNSSINGLVLSEVGGTKNIFLNCGGSSVVIDGKTYVADDPYLDQSAATLLPTSDDWTKAIMLKYCNYGVCGNQFKWSGIEPTKGVLNYAPFDSTFSWFNQVGWSMRAHNLLWGGNNSTDYHCVPQWVMNLSSTPKVMYDTCRMRVIREVTRYKGKIKEYDVLNEPTHANYLQSIVGDSIDWNCFKWAHEADPDARLFINDYNIIEWQDQTDNFVALVKKMLQNGAPVTGIGSQCHIGSSVDITNFKNRFDQLGQFGLPVKVTEFDMAATSLTEQQYAVEMGKMMRLAFSHPAIEGFIFWGLTEPTWIPASICNVIREDKTTKIAADTVYHLIHEVWTTDKTGVTDANGSFMFNGYYGDYDVLVKVNGAWKKFEINCPKAEKGKQFDLVESTGIAPCPELEQVKVVEPNQIYLTFDKEINNPASEVKNFKIFDSKMNYIKSAELKSDDAKTIILSANSPIGTRDYAPVSYAPGALTAADGGVLWPFGPVLSDKLKPGYLLAKTSSDGKQVQIYFDNNLIDTSIIASDYVVKINNKDTVITSAILGSTKNYVVLNLEGQITRASDVVTVSYLSGSLMRSDGCYLAAFNSKSVTNNVVAPSFVSASTNSTGNIIYVYFDQYLGALTNQESSFVLASFQGQSYKVSKAAVNSMNKKQLVLTLESPIYKGDTVDVVFIPGEMRSYSNNIPVSGFSARVSNLSVTALTDNKDQSITVYPNPFNDHLIINHGGKFSAVTVTDLNGKVLIHQVLTASASESINTSSLQQGVYLLELSDGQKKNIFKIVKE